MHIQNKLPKSSFIKLSKKDFFLKYLEKKGLLDLNQNKNNSTSVKKIDSIDLKELINEKNIKITIYDIITDYRNFRREYYTYTNEIKESDKVKLPFERKDTNLKNIIYYFFFSDKFSDFGRLVIFLLSFNLVFFIIHWRKERVEKLNMELLSKMTPNKKGDELEKQKHSSQKWKNF